MATNPLKLIDPNDQVGILRAILTELRVLNALVQSQAPTVADDPDILRNDINTEQNYPQ